MGPATRPTVGAFLAAPCAGPPHCAPLLPGTEPVDLRYPTVIFWGGMRGGMALALPPIPGKDTVVVPLVMGAVLFTLLVQGFTIRRLVRLLGLDVPPLSDRGDSLFLVARP